MKRIVMLLFCLLSLSSCNGLTIDYTVNPTQIEISKQTLVAKLDKTAIPNQPASATIQAPENTLSVNGSISGNLSYPSEFIPGMLVVAYRMGTTEFYSISTADSQGAYQIDNLPAGTYHVVAYYESLSAGYSQAVPCGLSVNCVDHSLIDVVVTAGSVASGINPMDWYAPTGSFPSKP
jgi:hypothetical protein